MAQFLIEVAYTPQSWAALIKNPQDRTQAVQGAVESLGGKVDRLWLSFGEYDAVALVEMPDAVSAAAVSMAFAAGGSCRTVRTIPLLTAQEAMEAMKKASRCAYRPIAQAATA